MGDEDRRPCPFCAEPILTAAVLCRYCGSRLDSSPVPAGPRAPGWVDLVAGVGILWGAELVLGVVLVLGAGLKDPGSMTPGQVLLGTLASFLMILGVVGYFGCRRHGLSWREGLALTRVSRKALIWSVVGGVAIAALGIVLISRFSTGNSPMARMAAQPGGLAALIILALAAPPFEEMYYRGFLYPILQRKTRPWVALAVVMLWFTGAHLLQLQEDPVGLVPIFGMSAAATTLRAVTGSLVPAMMIHWVYNGVLVLSSLPAL